MSDVRDGLTEALSDRYSIERELGEGGMATVYLAKDLKHERNVALKVLKPELAAVIGGERFVSEIMTTAGLQHPHILPLFDSGEADGFLYYVMPYIEGETLRDRINRERQLPVDEALKLTKACAEALDYAHRHDVIHRDIKPENILIHEGQPVVADFGIALAISAAGGGRLTETGLSLGTPHYMSPEQATADRDLTARSDVYSLGAVLYEMLAGDPPHTGPSAQAILMRILTEDPRPITDQRRAVPPNVAAAVSKALEKLPADRFESAAALAEALDDKTFTYTAPQRAATGVTTPAPASASTGRPAGTPLLTGLAVVAAVATLAAVVGWMRSMPEPETLVARFDVTPPEPGAFVPNLAGRVVAISPDGEHIVYRGPDPSGTTTQLWQRQLEALAPTPIPGTEGGDNPVFSPDGSSLAFWENSSLKTVSLLGGPAVTIVPQGDLGSRYIDWGDDGWLYFGATIEDGGFQTFKVPATGGERVQVTAGLEGVGRITVPEVLPNGGGVLVTLRRGNNPDASTVGLVAPGGTTVRELFPGMSPHYSPSGHILYATANNLLMAVPFDAERLEITGSPVAVLEDLAIRFPGMAAHLALSETGTLVYRRGSGSAVGDGAAAQLVIVDLLGNEETVTLDPRQLRDVAWSPDGASIAYVSDGQIYTYDVSLETRPRQLTFDGFNASPTFSPDGTKVSFAAGRPGTDGIDLFLIDLNDDREPRSLVSLPASQLPTQWASDSVIVYESAVGGFGDLWWLDLSDPDLPRAEEYLASEGDLRRVALSPDGTLAAYAAPLDGFREIFIRSFPNPGSPTIVSQGGGDAPAWSPDGETLYYWDASLTGSSASDRTLMAARIERGSVPVIASVDALFTMRGIYPPRAAGSLHPDGDRFIIARPVGAGSDTASFEPDRLILIQNFFEELERLAPGR